MTTLVRSSRMDQVAGLAQAMRSFVQSGVVLVIGMALRAVRPHFFVFPGFPASNVLGIRYRFKMLRIDAATDTAQMVNVQSGWDWSNVKFVGDAVRLLHLTGATSHTEAAISVMASARPEPATAIRFRRDESHEAFKCPSIVDSHCDPPITVVRLVAALERCAGRSYFSAERAI